MTLFEIYREVRTDRAGVSGRAYTAFEHSYRKTPIQLISRMGIGVD